MKDERHPPSLDFECDGSWADSKRIVLAIDEFH
jgi:hypothetical protein